MARPFSPQRSSGAEPWWQTILWLAAAAVIFATLAAGLWWVLQDSAP